MYQRYSLTLTKLFVFLLPYGVGFFNVPVLALELFYTMIPTKGQTAIINKKLYRLNINVVTLQVTRFANTGSIQEQDYSFSPMANHTTTEGIMVLDLWHARTTGGNIASGPRI